MGRKRVEVAVLRGFTDGAAGGNPAGMVLDAERLTEAEKQAVAREVGLSETAFLSPSATATFRFDFFTPTRRIAHCGHATIAAFATLAADGLLPAGPISKETIDGDRAIRMDGERAFMEQQAPDFVGAIGELGVSDRDLATALGLSGLPPSDHPPTVVSTGNRFLLVPAPDEAAVVAARPDRALLTAISERLDLIGVYLFSPETRVAGRDAGARMFAPRYGIDEESATGMAAGPLGAFLVARMGRGGRVLSIEQGQLMNPPSPSLLEVRPETRGDAIASVLVGGRGARERTVTVSIESGPSAPPSSRAAGAPPRTPS